GREPEAAPDIWDGVFTTAQADRGKAVFTESCAHCHEDPNGDAPSLVGDSFMRHWEGRSLERLLMHIRENMPADGVESVSDAHKLDAMTYILRMNGFPTGQDELKGDADLLAQLQIVRK